jgi:hypothetical protein
MEKLSTVKIIRQRAEGSSEGQGAAPAADRIAASRSQGRSRPMEGAVQVPAQPGGQLSHRPKPDRQCRSDLVDHYPARAGVQGQPRRSLVPGDLGRRCRHRRTLFLRVAVGRDGAAPLRGADLFHGHVGDFALIGYLSDVHIWAVSVFYVMVLVSSFFGSGNYAIVGPYVAEVWPSKLRTSAIWESSSGRRGSIGSNRRGGSLRTWRSCRSWLRKPTGNRETS